MCVLTSHIFTGFGTDVYAAATLYLLSSSHAYDISLREALLCHFLGQEDSARYLEMLHVLDRTDTGLVGYPLLKYPIGQ